MKTYVASAIGHLLVDVVVTKDLVDCTNRLVSARAGKMGVYATIEVGGLLRHLLRRQTCDDRRQEAGRREVCYPLRRLFVEILSVNSLFSTNRIL